ncbi:MAG: beta-lactamase family protein [Lachnospiraceae bacterium]|nr:beta-lactamase family protein [Lachnospiraceae bacterium]
MDFTNLKKFMDYMAAERTPGNAVEVYLDGKQVFRYFTGYSDLATRTPLTGDEMYNIYSCSKVTTVTAATQLLERGKILLAEPLYEYIPEYKEMYIKKEDGSLVKAQNPITIGDLFSMTAGLTYNTNTEGIRKARELTGGKMDTVTTAKCIAMDTLQFEPGTHWAYSLCHDVLAALVSVVSGQKFRDYVKENIFDPLDMKESVYHHTEETLKRTATQYSFVPAGDKNFDIVEAQKHGCAKDGMFKEVGKGVNYILGEEYDSGGAGIISTVSDYVKLMAALANYGMGLTGERILSQYSVDLMRTNRLNDTQLKDFNWRQLKGCGYGLGVRTHMRPDQSGVISNPGEFGWGGAAGATAIIDPSINLGVFYAQHTLNPREGYYQPRLRNVVYSCL